MTRVKLRRRKVSNRKSSRRNPSSRLRERIPVIGKWFRKETTPGAFDVKDGTIIVDAKSATAVASVFSSLTDALKTKVPIYFSPDGGKTKYQINVIRVAEEEEDEDQFSGLPSFMRRR